MMIHRLATIALIGVGLLTAAPSLANTKINLFACEPEWASLAKHIGGDYVNTYSATNAQQDPHYIRARPSLIAKMRRSDIVLCAGADLEVGWLPILLQKSGNPDVQPGGKFHIMAANLVPLLDQRDIVDRSMGDIHAAGNPHVHLNPYHILKVAAVLNSRLQQIAPEHRNALQSQYNTFVTTWKDAILKWEQQAAPLKGKPVIVHHASWRYLNDWLGLDRVATLEPKPGIAPTTGHLEKLLQTVSTTAVSTIIRTPYDPDKASTWLSQKAAIPALVLPYTVGGNEKSTDLFSLYDNTLNLLLKTLHD